jgi:nucleobase transporter 1/2
LRQVGSKRMPIFERMPILLSVPVIWAFAHILTVGGAYNNVPKKTKLHCRTDEANLISSTPW